jgi:catechol 2,3-dioxygenase
MRILFEGGGRMLADSFPIAYVSLNISNMEKSLSFYQSVIGLHALLISGRTAVLGTSGGLPLLLLYEQREAAKLREPGATGIDHFALLVPDRKELARQLTRIKDNQYPLYMISDHGVNESIYMHDPDGTLVEISRDLSAEELAGHRPLSPQELADQLLSLSLHADDSEPFRGGKFGHLLLRAANLSQAEQYYVRKLGFQVTMRMPGAVFVASGNYHHHLGFHVWESEGGAPPDPSTIGIRHYGIYVESYDSFENRFERDPSGLMLVLMKKSDVNLQSLIEIDQSYHS